MMKSKHFILCIILLLLVGVSSAVTVYDEQYGGVTGKGASGVLVPLGIPITHLYLYTWVSLCILFLIAASASQRNGEFWAILLPIFAAMFVWWGWLVMPLSTGMGVIIMAAVLAVGIYFKGKQQAAFGIAGPGSPFLNIVFWMIMMQASIGFINAIGLFAFQGNTAVTPTAYQNIDLSESIPDYAQTGGVGADVTATLFFAATAVITSLTLFWKVVMGIIWFKSLVLSIASFIGQYAIIDLFLNVISVGIDFIIAIAVWTMLFKPPMGENI